MDQKTVSEITGLIDKNHDEFLKYAGDIPYRISADYQLELANITSKVCLICTLLQRKEIIDDFELINGKIINTFVLNKNGLDFGVQIFASGESICLETLNKMVPNSIGFREYTYPDSKRGWNWVSFSERILKFIHVNVYNAQKVGELKVSNMLNGESE